MGARHDFGVDAAEILIQRQTEKFGGGAGSGKGNAEHGVCAETGLVVRAVKIKQGGVHLHLAQGVKADDGFSDFSVHMLHRLGDALALVARGISVAQLKGFAGSGGGAGGHGSAAHMAGFQPHFHFHRRIAAESRTSRAQTEVIVLLSISSPCV